MYREPSVSEEGARPGDRALLAREPARRLSAYKTNPELTRNLWLEFSPARLAGMPLVLAGIFYLAYLNNQINPWGTIADAASNLFIVLVFVWGGYRAASAVVDEVSDNTWDFQRLSSLTPSSMTIGKLFGSTSYTWYGAAFALAIYIFAELMRRTSPAELMHDVTLLLLTGLFCQTATLLVSMHNMHKRDDFTRRHTILYLVFGLLMASAFYRLAKTSSTNMTEWYGHEYQQTYFALLSLLLFLGWALGGLYRTFRHELQYRCGPGFWGAFILFCMLYSAGFTAHHFSGVDDKIIQTLAHYWPPFLTGGLFIYLSLYFDDRNLVQYRQLFTQYKARNWREAYLHTPRWLVAALLFAAASLVIMALLPASISLPVVNKTASPPGFILAALLFSLRDVAIVHYFSFGPKPRRADFASSIFLSVAYILLPSILSSAGNLHLLSWVLPGITSGFFGAVLPPLVQCGVAVLLLRRRLTSSPVQ